MGPKSAITLCRICLIDGATCPIFDDDKTGHGVHGKLSKCFGEKIENIHGYPQNICNTCHETLNIICDFVAKYEETCKILRSHVLLTCVTIKKEETEYNNCYSDNEIHSEVDAEVHPKTELDNIELDDDDELGKCLIEFIQPLHLEMKRIPKKVKAERKENKRRRKENFKKKQTLKRNKDVVRKNTGEVGSSILEGYFEWDGEHWCPSTEDITKDFKYTADIEIKTRRKRITKNGKLPKVKKPNEPKLCDLCGETFKTQDKLTSHSRNIHFPQKLQCPHCPKVSPTEFYLKRHVKRAHEKIKDFVCSECGTSFCYKSELNIHTRRVHQKDKFPKKVFSCSFCHKTYACQKSVTVHERSVHTGERPAVCSMCDSTFYHEEYLKEHMRLHTGETPFKCPVCARGYAQRGNMKSHIRIHRVTECSAETLSKIRPNYLRLMKP